LAGIHLERILIGVLFLSVVLDVSFEFKDWQREKQKEREREFLQLPSVTALLPELLET
jgi:hypothetical protein